MYFCTEIGNVHCRKSLVFRSELLLMALTVALKYIFGTFVLLGLFRIENNASMSVAVSLRDHRLYHGDDRPQIIVTNTTLLADVPENFVDSAENE